MTVKWKDYLFVSLQFILFFCFVFDLNWSMNLDFGLRETGFWIGVLGGLIILVALLQLNTNISPFPTPKNNSILLQHGLYKSMRHPIYTGIMVLFSGYSLYRNSFYKLGISLLLILLFYFKSKYEELRLEQKFSEYKKYKNRTNRFIPWF